MFFRSSKIFIAALVGISITAVGAYLPTADNANEGTQSYLYGGVRTASPAVGLAVGCGDVFDFEPPATVGVVPETYTGDKIPSPTLIIPSFGYMSPKPFAPDTTYDITDVSQRVPYDYAAIQRALWEGWYVVWVTDDITGDTLQGIQNYVTERNADPTQQADTLLLRWTGPANLPGKTQVAFSAWGQSQSCVTFSGQAFESFADHYEARSINGRNKQSPPVAPLDSAGRLPEFRP